MARKNVARSNSFVSNSSQMKFRSNMEGRGEGKGTRPVQEPASIGTTLVQMITHCCRKIMFVDTQYLICTYLGGLFLLSLLAGAIPFPRTPLSRRDSILNVYFVKLAWGWTLLLTIPQVVVTAAVYCCGKRPFILKHLLRLVVATGFWLFWTNLFVYFERLLGYCSNDALFTKSSCISKGFYWKSMDISGHCFILIYSTLVLIEESRVIVNWDTIGHLLRDEEHSRTFDNDDPSRNPLSRLSNEELFEVRERFGAYTPMVRGLFILTTGLVLVWHLMLLTTVLYFHNMLEKLLAGVIAILTWYLTYRLWFTSTKLWPPAPGEGVFSYRQSTTNSIPQAKAPPTKSKLPGPRFMGMPLNIPQEKTGNSSGSSK